MFLIHCHTHPSRYMWYIYTCMAVKAHHQSDRLKFRLIPRDKWRSNGPTLKLVWNLKWINLDIFFKISDSDPPKFWPKCALYYVRGYHDILTWWHNIFFKNYGHLIENEKSGASYLIGAGELKSNFFYWNETQCQSKNKQKVDDWNAVSTSSSLCTICFSTPSTSEIHFGWSISWHAHPNPLNQRPFLVDSRWFGAN